METLATDSPGDCQTIAAVFTTTTSTTTSSATTTEITSTTALIAVTENKKNPKIKTTRRTERVSRQKRAISSDSVNPRVEAAGGSGSGNSLNAATTTIATTNTTITAAATTTTNEDSSTSVAAQIPRRTRSSKMCLSPSPTNNHHQNINSSSSTTSNNNNNSNNKLQLQQQQQPNVPATTIKFHHFRAPQHFVKHKRATSMLAKKNKAWNKRQNKCHLHKQQKHPQQQQHHRNHHHQHNLKQQQKQQHQQDSTCKNLCMPGVGNGACSGSGGGGGNSGASNNGLGSSAAAVGSGVAGVLPPTKADLENIQNVKNQLGSGGGGGHHHHQYYQNHHHHHQHHQQHGGHHGSRGGSGGNCIASCLCNLGKLGYGHGHLKQQIYKKMLVHRGHHHHHHVLGSGAAHSTAASVKSICCLANGCTVQNGKDSVNLSSHNTASHPNLSHYCCGRSKFFLPEKRPRKEVIIPPTKFLLGGTISDPLNLNSLQNESASNASSNNNTPTTTPRQSPITTPPKVEVIIPPNIHDPLHLLDPVDSMEYEKQLTSPLKRRIKNSTKKHRHRKNRKPKRRRYESYTSTVTLEDGGTSGSASTTLNSSSLINSALTTESVTVNASSTISSNISNSLSSINSSSGVGACSGNVKADDGLNKSALLRADADLPLSSKFNDSLEKNTIVSPNCGQQHVDVSVGESFVGTESKSPALRIHRSIERERASKDLRLELNTNGGHGGTNNSHNNNNNNLNNSAASSTCGSITTIGCIGFVGGGRKRKISESSGSQKNKKYHRLDSMDKIVSPVVPQPGAWKRPPRTLPSGARKPTARRSTSMSENELLSPAEENLKTIIDSATNRVDTPDVNKVDSISEAGFGSPLSTASGATSHAVGEQDSMPDVGTREVKSKAEEQLESKIASNTIPSSAASSNIKSPPKFRPEGAKYQYGNYDRYAGLRNLNDFMDVRLHVFQRHLELFKDRDILDIGCNVGHMTITVARNLSPKSILGIDIDKDLIARARRNLSMYVRIPPEAASVKEETKTPEEQKPEVSGVKLKRTRRQWKKNKQRQLAAEEEQHKQLHNAAIRAHHHHLHHPHQFHHLLYHHHHHHQVLHNRFQPTDSAEFFPISFPINFGGIPPDVPVNAAPTTNSSTPGHGGCSSSNAGGDGASKVKNDFPKNVYFRRANYVLKDEAQLNDDTQQYDLIMCLSVTKWIHLNFGDNGLKLAFKRMFNQLRPGGKLILEAQNWASYKKRKNLTEQIYNNYRNIEFFPNKFHEYLLSSEVGFSHSYTLGVPRHLNKGFCRPIQLYAKGDYTPNHVRWSDAYYPQTPYEAYRGIYATLPPRSHPLISSSRSQNYDTPHHPGIGSASGGAGGVGGPGSSSSYSCRQTPMHQPTSQYYNPLETDSYLPSYDMEYLNHLYVFASPLYQTIWSPPTSLRNSSTHTPLFGSIREAELDGDIGGGGGAFGGSYHRHVYPPNDDTSSPNANVGGAFNSIRDPDTDDSNQLPTNSLKHVYATNCESSSSPNGLHAHESSEPIDESLILADVNDEVGLNGPNCCGDLKEA